MPKASLTQKKKPCPAAEMSPDATPHARSTPPCPAATPRALQEHQPAGLASLAKRQAREQPTATRLSDNPGVIKSSHFTPEIHQTKPVSRRVDCTKGTGGEEREMEWPCLDRVWSLSLTLINTWGFIRVSLPMLSTTMSLAILLERGYTHCIPLPSAAALGSLLLFFLLLPVPQEAPTEPSLPSWASHGTAESCQRNTEGRSRGTRQQREHLRKLR